MIHGNDSSLIDQAIFNSGLSVETISLYLLCCGLIDAGLSASMEMLRERWNAPDEAFDRSLEELLEKNVLQKKPAEHAGGIEFQPTERHHWRL